MSGFLLSPQVPITTSNIVRADAQTKLFEACKYISLVMAMDVIIVPRTDDRRCIKAIMTVIRSRGVIFNCEFTIDNTDGKKIATFNLINNPSDVVTVNGVDMETYTVEQYSTLVCDFRIMADKMFSAANKKTTDSEEK